MSRWVLNIGILFFCFLHFAALKAQSTDSLSQIAENAEKQISEYKVLLDSLQLTVKTIQQQLVVYPKWEKGVRGIVGVDLNTYDNWVNRKKDLNSSSVIIALNFDGSIHKIGRNYFWRNRGKLRLGWQRIMNNEEDDTAFQKTTDQFRIDTHYGRKLSKKLAFSALTEFETTFLESSFNPAYLDLSIGFTYTEKPNLTAIIHPINYSIVISSSDQFESSPGAKLIIEYRKRWLEKIQFTSDFNGFFSYDSSEDLNSYKWTNSFHLDVLKNLGFGFEYAIKVNKQETAKLNPDTENHFQSYFIMGFSVVF